MYMPEHRAPPLHAHSSPQASATRPPVRPDPRTFKRLTNVCPGDVIQPVPQNTRDALAVGQLELGDARSGLEGEMGQYARNGVAPGEGRMGRAARLTMVVFSDHRVGAVARNWWLKARTEYWDLRTADATVCLSSSPLLMSGV